MAKRSKKDPLQKYSGGSGIRNWKLSIVIFAAAAALCEFFLIRGILTSEDRTMMILVTALMTLVFGTFLFSLIRLGRSVKGEEEKKWDYYERLVKADSSDHDIIVIVADHFEKIGDRKSAMNYYQRALLRLQGTDEIQKMKDIFTKLIANGRSEYPFYSSFLESLSETNPETALELYRTLLSALLSAKDGYEPKSSEHRRNLDNIIEISKRILAIDPEDQNTRKTLAAILKEKYAESPRLQECMKKHNVLTQKNPASVLEDFEKDISYAAGTYIFQKANRRVGLITGVKNGIVSVRYSATEEQNITLESAFNALLPLSKQNIKAIKKGVPAPKIKAKIMGEGGIEWLVRTLLLSAQNNKASMKEMKTEVVPSILTDGEWKSITERIKEELRNNSYVRIIPGTTDYFQLTAYPSTPEEKILYIFRNEQSFYGKASTVIDAATSAGIEKTSDAFMDMVSDFEDVLSNEKKSLGERTASVLLLDYLSEKGASVSFDVSFDVLYRAMSEAEKKEVFDSIDNTILKKEFIDQVISADKKGAAAVLTDIFPYYIHQLIHPAEAEEASERCGVLCPSQALCRVLQGQYSRIRILLDGVQPLRGRYLQGRA